MSLEEDVAAIKTDLRWLRREWESRPCEAHDIRLRGVEGMQNIALGGLTVIGALVGAILTWIVRKWS